MSKGFLAYISVLENYFSAGHEGVPNTQLVKEGTAAAIRYKNVSVAEQNSVDVAWGILMEQEFQQLRETIYADQNELFRFRQLVVNVSWFCC